MRQVLVVLGQRVAVGVGVRRHAEPIAEVAILEPVRQSVAVNVITHDVASDRIVTVPNRNRVVAPLEIDDRIGRDRQLVPPTFVLGRLAVQFHPVVEMLPGQVRARPGEILNRGPAVVKTVVNEQRGIVGLRKALL